MRREMVRLLDAGASTNVFPGASACIAYREGKERVYLSATGGLLAPRGDAVDEKTFYDLASLTKPVTAVTALRMAMAGAMDLDEPIGHALSDLRGSAAETVSLRTLLSHRSGLEAWGGFYLDVPHEPGSGAARRWIVSEASRRVSNSSAARRCVYSDLGYIIAGELLSRINKTPLNEAVREWVTSPLNLEDTLFFAGESGHGSALKRSAPTERCDWRGRVVRGEVGDENCAALGGISGHAGLFGTAESVARFGVAMLDVHQGASNFVPKAEFNASLSDPGDGSTWRMGWDTRSKTGSSGGQRMSENAFGHLGFTGTSIWCDPERDVVVVLLSNRVHPSRANEKIRGFRPAFHDGVLGAFDS
ncbi:MAG: serine hydrolase domain-containing protein [Polyangiales bacterium]